MISSGRKKQLVWLVCAVTVILHVVIILIYASNVPFSDDYDAILSFINDFVTLNTFSEKVDLVVARHNEHRIVLGKLVTLLQYSVSGKINFFALCIVGNIFLISLFAAIARYYRSLNISWSFFFPAAFIMFNLAAFEAFLWPMVVLQTMGVLLFAFLSIYFLTGQVSLSFTTRLILSFVSGVVATFACGNGMLILFVGLAAMILQQINIRYIIIWAIASAAVIYANMLGYKHVSLEHPSPMVMLLQYPEMLIPHFFAMVGEYFYFGLPILLLAGFALISILLYWLIPSAAFRKNPVAFYFLMFLILSCVLTSLSRANFGARQALAHRYHIYSALIVLFTYFSALSIIDLKKRGTRYFLTAFIVLTGGVYLLSLWRYIPRSRTFSIALIEGAVDYNENKSFSQLAYPNPRGAAGVLDQAKVLNTFSLPYSYDNLVGDDRKITLPQESNNIFYSLNLKPHPKVVMLDSSFAFIPGESYSGTNTFIVLKSESKTYVFSTRPVDVTKTTDVYQPDVGTSGFKLFLNKDAIDVGAYRVGLLLKGRGENNYELTNSILEKKANGEIKYMQNGPQTFTHEVLELNARYSIDIFERAGEQISVKGWALVFGVPSVETKISLVLASDKERIQISPSTQKRPDVSSAFNNNYDDSGFIFNGPMRVPPGRYKLSIIVSTHGVERELVTDTELIVNP